MMVQESLCFFSVARYVADPIRNEAKNVGVLLVSPERGFGGARFSLSRAGLPRGSRQHAMFQAIAQRYSIDLPGYRQPDLFTPVPPSWTRTELEQLHRECTNLLQFSEPVPIIGDPSGLLDQVFRERVLPRRSGVRSPFTRATVVRVLRRTLAREGRADWVQEDAQVPVDGDKYQFDVGIGNGRLYYAIEMLSFRNKDLLRVEHEAGWFAYVWPAVARQTGAKGLLVVEPPETESASPEGYPQIEYRKIAQWAERAGIEVRDVPDSKTLEPIAEEIAQGLGDLVHA